jgi:hypothetical protein
VLPDIFKMAPWTLSINNYYWMPRLCDVSM